MHDVGHQTTAPTVSHERCDIARQFVTQPASDREDLGARIHIQRSDPLAGPSQTDADGQRLATWSPAGVIVHDLGSGREILATRAVDRDRWGWIDDRIVTLDAADDAWVATSWPVLGDVEHLSFKLEPDLGAPSVVSATGLMVMPWLRDAPDARCGPDARSPSAFAWRRLSGDTTVQRLGLREPACSSVESFWGGDGTWAMVFDRWRMQLVSLEDGRWGAESSADAKVLAAGRSVLITAEAGHVYAVSVVRDPALPSLGERRELLPGTFERVLVGPRDQEVALIDGQTVQVVSLGDESGKVRERALAADHQPITFSPDGCALIVSNANGQLGALGFGTAEERWVGQPRAPLVVERSLASAVVRGEPIRTITLESPLPLASMSPASMSPIEETESGVAIAGVAPPRLLPWPAGVASEPSTGHVALTSSKNHVALLTFVVHPWTLLSDRRRELGRSQPAALTVHDIAQARSWTKQLDEPSALAITSDTLIVATGRERSTLTRLDLADGHLLARTRLPELPGGVLLSIDASSDASVLAGVTNDPAHLVVIDLERGELRLAHDLQDPRHGPTNDSPYRFRDLANELLTLSADGSWLSWTDPFSTSRDELGLLGLPHPPLRSDGAHTSVWRVGTQLELHGHYAWVTSHSDGAMAADVHGRVFELEPSKLTVRRWSQVYANGAWVVWAGPDAIERSTSADDAAVRIDAMGVEDFPITVARAQRTDRPMHIALESARSR